MGAEGHEGRHAAGTRRVLPGFELAESVERILREHGYAVANYTDTRGCVDLVARKGDEIFVIRVLSNVDALREESAKELSRLASVLHAKVFIIGTHTKHERLAEGTVYWRYGLPVVSLETFGRILEGDLPTVEVFKGRRLVPVDGQKLREVRRARGLSLQHLAELVGTTKETIYRYEHGYLASEEVVVRIEQVLGASIRDRVDLSRVPKADEEVRASGLLSRVRRHLPIRLFRRTPWDALFRRELMLSEARGNIRRRAELLLRGREIVAKYPAFVGEQGGKAYNIPILTPEELQNKPKEVVRILREKYEEG